MFRNLSVGQWIVFLILTLFTFFGGFVYVAAEAHFNRSDRAFIASPDGERLALRQSVVRETRPTRAPINWGTVGFCLLVAVVFGLGAILVGGLK